MLRKRLLRLAIATGLILMVPLVAMQFTDEVQWGFFDFVIMGILLFGSGLTYELIARRGGTRAYRIAVGISVAAGLLLIWMNLAVGIIGSENNPANTLYAGVLIVGLIGVFIARFKPHGMARAAFATAITQFIVPIVAMIIWRPSFDDASGIIGVFMLNTFFAALFFVSALLFRRASEHTPRKTDIVSP